MPRTDNRKKFKTYEERFKVFKEICSREAAGGSVKKICKDFGLNEDWYYGFLWDNEDKEEVAKLSARARRNKAHNMFNKASEALEDLRSGEIDSSTARVLCDGYLRIAGKANQALYGDMMKTQMVDGEGKGINPFDEIYKAICKEKDYVR